MTSKSKREVLELLRTGPLTIGELTAATGLSVNAVRFHLDSLVAEGLAEVVGTRPSRGPGKPATLYMVSANADLGFSRAYAPALAAAIAEIRTSLPAKQVIPFLHRIGRRLGAGAALQGKPLPVRVRAASDFLNAIGGLTSVARTKEGYRIVGKGCPLAAVVEREPCTCEAVEALVSEIVGRRATERCDRTGRPSCCFELTAG